MQDSIFSSSDLPSAETRVFDDYVLGATYESREFAVSAGDIKEFARKFDPQPFHLDDENEGGVGLIASGWHTSAIMMKLMVQDFLPANANLPSPGVNELRWLKPVLPGDNLRNQIKITDKRLSSSKPDVGIMKTHVETLNQDDELVLSLEVVNFMRTRDALQR